MTDLDDVTPQPMPARFEDVRALMVAYLRQRSIAREDAQDAVQNAMLKIVASPKLKAMIRDLDVNAGYFKVLAMNEARQIYRSERTRRLREELYSQARDERVEDDALDELSEFMSVAGLTKLQRQYLADLYLRYASVRQIASARGVTERAVRAVLTRAYEALRRASESGDGPCEP